MCGSGASSTVDSLSFCPPHGDETNATDVAGSIRCRDKAAQVYCCTFDPGSCLCRPSSPVPGARAKHTQ